MYYLSDFCCICLNNTKDLRHMSTIDKNGVSYYIKLSSSLQGMIFNQKNKHTLICKECRKIVDFVYEFQHKCITSGHRLENYISQLKIVGKTEAVLSVRLLDYVKLNVKQEMLHSELETVKCAEPVEYLPDICHVDVKVEPGLETESAAAENNVRYELTGNKYFGNHMRNDFSNNHLQPSRECSSKFVIEMPVKCAEPVEYLPDVCHVDVKSEADLQTENTAANFSNTHQTKHVQPRRETVVCPNNFETEIPVVDMWTTLRGVGQGDVNNIHDPLMIVDDTKSNIGVINNEDVLQKTHNRLNENLPKFSLATNEMDVETDNQGHIHQCVPEKKKGQAEFVAETSNLDDVQNVSEIGSKLALNLDYLRSQERPYKCDQCGSTFVSQIYLNRHVQIHTGIRKYACKICEKKFTLSGNLTKHMLTHTGVKAHECNICHKKFGYVDSLKRHMSIHTGEKPHECTVCQKSFRLPDCLAKHMMIHTGDLPHDCSVCEKRFRLADSLKKHMLIHTGVKPHQCNVCQKRFSKAGHLTVHMLTHTGAKPHECNFCERKFTQASALKRHMVKHPSETLQM